MILRTERESGSGSLIEMSCGWVRRLAMDRQPILVLQSQYLYVIRLEKAWTWKKVREETEPEDGSEGMIGIWSAGVSPPPPVESDGAADGELAGGSVGLIAGPSAAAAYFFYFTCQSLYKYTFNSLKICCEIICWLCWEWIRRCTSFLQLHWLTGGVLTLHAPGSSNARVWFMVIPKILPPLSAVHRHRGWDCTTLPSCAQHEEEGVDEFPVMKFKQGESLRSTEVHPDCAAAPLHNIPRTTRTRATWVVFRPAIVLPAQKTFSNQVWEKCTKKVVEGFGAFGVLLMRTSLYRPLIGFILVTNFRTTIVDYLSDKLCFSYTKISRYAYTLVIQMKCFILDKISLKWATGIGSWNATWRKMIIVN